MTKEMLQAKINALIEELKKLSEQRKQALQFVKDIESQMLRVEGSINTLQTLLDEMIKEEKNEAEKNQETK